MEIGDWWKSNDGNEAENRKWKLENGQKKQIPRAETALGMAVNRFGIR
jgi:hypothetical protein